MKCGLCQNQTENYYWGYKNCMNSKFNCNVLLYSILYLYFYIYFLEHERKHLKNKLKLVFIAQDVVRVHSSVTWCMMINHKTASKHDLCFF